MPETTTERLTDQQLAEIAARANAATEGPWGTTSALGTRDPMCRGDVGIVTDAPRAKDVLPMIGEVWAERVRNRPDHAQAHANAAFIAAARADVPALLAEVRRESDAHEDTLRDLAETQRALVLLANQLERHQVPFVPEAEQATFVARRAVERDDALIARGMDAARAVFESRRPTTPAPAVEAR